MRAEEFYLRDIIIACKTANKFAGDINWETFVRSRLYQSAIQFNLMIIGEASSKISRGLRSRHPEVDWQTIKDFRNILAHEYFSLDLEIVWSAAVTRTLPLAGQVHNILSIEYPEFPFTNV